MPSYQVPTTFTFLTQASALDCDAHSRLCRLEGKGDFATMRSKEDWDNTVQWVLESAERCGVLGWSTGKIVETAELARQRPDLFPGYDSELVDACIDSHVGPGERVKLGSAGDEVDAGFAYSTPIYFELLPVFRATATEFSGGQLDALFLAYWKENERKSRWIGYLANNPDIVGDPSIFEDGTLDRDFSTRDDRHPQSLPEVTMKAVVNLPENYFLVTAERLGSESYDHRRGEDMALMIWKIRHFLDTVANPAGHFPRAKVGQTIYDGGEGFSEVFVLFDLAGVDTTQGSILLIQDHRVAFSDE
jgi:hypothetical protein